MKAILSAILASGLILSASAQTAPPSPPIESVIVTAPNLRSEEVLNNFVISHTAPSPWLGKIARWKAGICPVTIGLPEKFNNFITQRIIRVAMAAGAPLDSHEPCRPNVVVLATAQPQELLDMLRTKHGSVLGYHYRSQDEALATMRLPIQGWHSTVTEDFWGFIKSDTEGLDVSNALPGVAAVPYLNGALHVSGFRGNDGLKSEFALALVIVDTRKIAGQEIGALADYIAMLSLSDGRSYDSCQEVPTITNLLAPNCPDAMHPTGLTDIDLTYLRGLYKMSAGSTYVGERGSIAYEMKKELGGY